MESRPEDQDRIMSRPMFLKARYSPVAINRNPAGTATKSTHFIEMYPRIAGAAYKKPMKADMQAKWNGLASRSVPKRADNASAASSIVIAPQPSVKKPIVNPRTMRDCRLPKLYRDMAAHGRPVDAPKYPCKAFPAH
jgi:hypothetical protein